MLGAVFALPVLLITASAMAQSPKVDQLPISSGSSMPREAVPASPALAAATPARLTDDEQRQQEQQDTHRRTLLMLFLNTGGRVQPFSGMSR
jgi:hypothetical protein